MAMLVECDRCHGRYPAVLNCEKCDAWGQLYVPHLDPVRPPSQLRALHLLTRVFVFCLCMAAVFILAYEFFGLWVRK